MTDEEPELSWSQWLDFNKENIMATPQEPGVFLTHASMKVLYIGGGSNIQEMLLGLLLDACANKATRFHYALSQEPGKIKEKLLKEYLEKHKKLPQCMEEAKPA